jgi:prepilin-type N-terminal cleavage/methylation domain-containing protein
MVACTWLCNSGDRFTLIELSIVHVVIGLLAGGVACGT